MPYSHTTRPGARVHLRERLFRRLALHLVPLAVAPAAALAAASCWMLGRDAARYVLPAALVLALVAAAAATALAWVLARRIVRPIQELTAAVLALGEDRLQSVIVPRTQDEIQQLGLQFNRMIGQLMSNMERLKEATAENARLSLEFDIARKLQEGVLPTEPGHYAGFTIEGHSFPAREVGGDFFDYGAPPGGRVFLVIGDASGKGLPAAFFAAQASSVGKTLGIAGGTPGEVLTRSNNIIAREFSKRSMFLTAFLAHISTDGGTMVYASAGHPPALLFREGEEKAVRLGRTGPLLGAFEEIHINDAEVGLRAGDLLVCYTDGVIEAFGPGLAEYGLPRLERVVGEHRTRPPGEIIAALRQDLAHHRGGQDQNDDITIMVARYGHEDAVR